VGFDARQPAPASSQREEVVSSKHRESVAQIAGRAGRSLGEVLAATRAVVEHDEVFAGTMLVGRAHDELCRRLDLPPTPGSRAEQPDPVASLIERAAIPTIDSLSCARFEREGARFRVYLHQDFLDGLDKYPSMQTRALFTIRQLAAHGRPNRVKPTRGNDNRGWRRTPLEGNHFYAWWAPHNARPVRGAGLEERAILLRDLRHHDDHRPLDAGQPGDRVAISAADCMADATPGADLGRALFDSPWTTEQPQ
jgi:hypothetical protein